MLRCERGSATLLAFIVMSFLGIIISALLPMISNEVTNANRSRDVLEAQYAAESGVKRAVVGFTNSSTDWDWLESQKNFRNDSTKTYSVTVAPALTTGSAPPISATPYVITSVGRVGNATKTVTVSATVSAWEPLYAADAAIYAKGKLSFKKDCAVYDAPVASGETASVDLTISPSTYKFYHKTLSMPEINESDYIGKSAPPSSGGELSGKYYVSGKWSLSKDTTFTGDAQIYVDGDIDFAKDATFNGKFEIIYTGNLDVSKKFTLDTGLLIGLGADKTTSFKKDTNGDPLIRGAIMVNGDLSFSKDAIIRYNKDIIKHFGLTTSPSGTSTTFHDWISK